MSKNNMKNSKFLDLLSLAIAKRIRSNWKEYHPEKVLKEKDLEKLVSIKLALALSWGEEFVRNIKSKTIDLPEEPFKDKEEYIEWFLDQLEQHQYQKDLKEVKNIFSGKIKKS
jgi:hypothetical protein